MISAAMLTHLLDLALEATDALPEDERTWRIAAIRADLHVCITCVERDEISIDLHLGNRAFCR